MSRDEQLREVMHNWFQYLDVDSLTEEEYKAIERAMYYFDMQPGLMRAMHDLQVRLNDCMGY